MGDDTNKGTGDTTAPVAGDAPVVTPPVGDAPTPMGGGTDPVKPEPVEPVTTPPVGEVTPSAGKVTPPVGEVTPPVEGEEGTGTPPATT